MSKSKRTIIRDTVVTVVVAVGTFVGVAIALPDSNAQASQEGTRGFWTATQKDYATQVLTAAPVSESPALAACVVPQIAQEHTFTDFLAYAKMASANDFSNPNRAQQSVINSLMFDALVCPEGS